MDQACRTIRHTGTLRVDAPPAHAFQLFTPPGEKFWIEGWDAEVLSGGDGRVAGAVFVTSMGGEDAFWIVVDYDEETLHARYARVAPDIRAGTVTVRARDDGSGSTEVTVTYALTALTEKGNALLAGFDKPAFGRMLADWERRIREAGLSYPLPFVTGRASSRAVSSGR